MFGTFCWRFVLISFIISSCLIIGWRLLPFRLQQFNCCLTGAVTFTGFRGSVDANGFPVGQYPEIRGTGYVESNDPVQVGGGAPQQRVFRNSQAATPAPSYGVSPSYQASQYEEQLYNFQNFNGQYYGNGKKWRWSGPCSFILTRQSSFKKAFTVKFVTSSKFDWRPGRVNIIVIYRHQPCCCRDMWGGKGSDIIIVL